MGKFDGVLFCTDLDGTLYKNDKTISQENKDAIEYFKGNGGYFSFITGRLHYYSKDVYDIVNPNAPFGCINGGGVYDGASKKYIFTKEVSFEALELVSYIEEKLPNVGLQICGFENTYFAKENDITIRFREITGLENIACDYKTFNLPIGKIIFCTGIEEEILLIEKLLKSHKLAHKFDFIRSERTLYEILPKGVNKALAFKNLANYLKVDFGKTIAIGDYDNDASMLKFAGLGVAVANASALAKESADLVTVSNEENAIAKIIYDLDKGDISL